jgi:hypothetical protein
VTPGAKLLLATLDFGQSDGATQQPCAQVELVDFPRDFARVDTVLVD